MPSLFTVCGCRVCFRSNEFGEPIHVHAAKGKPGPNAAKIRLTREGGCIIAHNKGKIPEKDLAELT